MNSKFVREPRYTVARFWRCALQVNPSTYQATYRGEEHGLDEAGYNQRILERCVALDIKVLGIADHGSVDAVDRLRQFLEPHGIVVFPGFEIASSEKIHMVCLFREGTSKDHLNRYLRKLSLTDSKDTVQPSRKTCLDLAQIIFDLGGFWYAAHMTGTSGLLRLNQDGGGLPHIWKNDVLVKAGQIPGPLSDLPPNYKNIILNKDPNYKRAHGIAPLNAKDVAKPEDLADPGASCWIKMTRPSFESFLTAFKGPDSRIRLGSPPEAHYSRIGRPALSRRLSGRSRDRAVCAFERGNRRTGTRTLEVEIVAYSDRLEVLSPGVLQNSMTVDKMLAGQRSPRNTTIVGVLRDYGYVDARGMGVRNKIVPLIRQASGEEPGFEATEDSVKVVLPRSELDR